MTLRSASSIGATHRLRHCNNSGGPEASQRCITVELL